MNILIISQLQHNIRGGNNVVNGGDVWIVSDHRLQANVLMDNGQGRVNIQDDHLKEHGPFSDKGWMKYMYHDNIHISFHSCIQDGQLKRHDIYQHWPLLNNGGTVNFNKGWNMIIWITTINTATQPMICLYFPIITVHFIFHKKTYCWYAGSVSIIDYSKQNN